ncbi:MAG: hypothetical protein GTO45_29535 [Candidatus Aminicenantes bacterium]|nr:hypothetical protein [Candidatus Aminicenantes bacterium]NIM82936.1 hypothetical protein [Candidatus Aminicenantes bacterium]NIN22313.1 hypothetical protein [Candidatus Aminicenantes bacterium]NIN46081.1 hypothetical protein [Candidatus Aminicenantes bacterium]NIN88917.1 hypothetical protein [Candidatus Aminicenantes bacterium]
MRNRNKFPFMIILPIFCMIMMFFMIFFSSGWKGNAESNEGFSRHFPGNSPWIIFCIIFMVFMFILFIFHCIRNRWGSRGSRMCDWNWWRDWKQDDTQNPIDILKTRLAKGEISEEEYDKLMKKIKDD